MEREILEPYWAKDDKTQIACKFKYKDGQEYSAFVSSNNGQNPDWFEIINKFGDETITKNTEAKKKTKEEQQALQQEEQEKQEAEFKTQNLYSHKLKFLDIPEIKQSKNTELKKKMRKAQSEQAATVYAAAIVIDFLNNPPEQIDTKDETK